MVPRRVDEGGSRRRRGRDAGERLAPAQVVHCHLLIHEDYGMMSGAESQRGFGPSRRPALGRSSSRPRRRCDTPSDDPARARGVAATRPRTIQLAPAASPRPTPRRSSSYPTMLQNRSPSAVAPAGRRSTSPEKRGRAPSLRRTSPTAATSATRAPRAGAAIATRTSRRRPRRRGRPTTKKETRRRRSRLASTSPPWSGSSRLSSPSASR